MPFSFTSEQMERLKTWKQYLETDESKEWASSVNRAVTDFNRILSDGSFATGTDLSGDQIDTLFSLMRKLSHDRALNSTLYEKNGLSEFNSKLRSLLYGSQPLVDRVDDFMTLKGIAEVSMSHFLVMHDPKTYPYITTQTYDMLSLDSAQEQEARNDAYKQYGITATAGRYDATLDYLQHSLVFSEIKKTFGLDTYYLVNELLWFARSKGDDQESALEGLTSVSIEKDLRDYLSKNPSLLGKDVKVVGKEYTTEVGRIDILCKDSKGTHIVVETKKGVESDKVVGQTARYMGWVSKNLGPCKGIIVVGEPDERLEYAVMPFEDKIQLKYYQVRFDIKDTPPVRKESSETST